MIKALIKKLLSPTLIARLNNIRAILDIHLIKASSKTRFTSSLYYLVFSHQFSREHQSVLKGRLAYEISLNDVGESSILLRRNIHRLEKGLIMKPRRDVFAEDYITETVDTFLMCQNQPEFCQQELFWARQVLEQYFAATKSTSLISTNREKFFENRIDTRHNEQTASPYLSDNRVKANLSSEQLEELFKQRRSTRWFLDQKVPKKLVTKAVDMASQAPSACNRQPFQYYFMSAPETAREVAKCAMGTKGFADNIMSLVVIVGDLSSYPKEQDRHVIYIDGGLSAMQFMLALETLGLASCPINWPDIEPYEKKLAKKLNLKSFQRPIMMIALGFPDPKGGIPFSQKKSAEQIIKEVN